MPAEFAAALKQMPEPKEAFSTLTPGQPRGYLPHSCKARQSGTPMARAGKHVDRILAGKGPDD